tara:strand:+ start:183 stop:617 length:435 start_codon:yes stop_codon:yes gene_type:complete
MRILITLLFISFSSLGQTLDDILSIKDLNTFKRIAIENDLGLDVEETTDDYLMYKDVEGRDDAMYLNGDGSFVFSFSKTYRASSLEINTTPYDEIFKEVKARCTFVEITSLIIDYACYECGDQKFEGTLGFAIAYGKGIIKQMK